MSKGMLACAIVVAVLGESYSAAAQEVAVRLLDQQPFDRITLKQSFQGEVIDTLILDLPSRPFRGPYPSEGKLTLKRVSEPSVLYEIDWSAIEKIEVYEQLLLSKANELTNKKEFSEAYAYLDLLQTYYPQLPGLQTAIERYLKSDAFDAFAAERFDESLSTLLSLYDFNSSASGLAEAVQAVTDRLLAMHLARRDYSAARNVLDSVEEAFPRLKIKSINSWRTKFRGGAEKQLEMARGYLEEGKFRQARQAIREALAILPSVANVKQLAEKINQLSPQISVGVTQLSTPPDSAGLPDVAASRVARLCDPQFVELIDFGGEGGIYVCPWGKLTTAESGLQFDVQLNEQALAAGITPEGLALELIKQANSAETGYREDFGRLLQDVAIRDGRVVNLHWQRPHVHPDALLQFPLRKVVSEENRSSFYLAAADKENRDLVVYDRRQLPADRTRPPVIVEQVFSSEEHALTALVRGEVDILERVAPWQVERLRQTKGVAVGSYRLPTIHVLAPNYSKPLMRRREFRRALCFGIDRSRILHDIVLGGEDRPGFQVLSGPLPAGVSLTDPLSYAYQQSIKPRPYEPRLAAVLATVARMTLKTPEEEETLSNPDGEPTEAQEPLDRESSVDPLVLAHPPEALARAVCQTIKLQLDAIGIPIQLAEQSATLDAASVDYDLRYTEYPLWEPLVDLRRLLGPAGSAGNCSPAMNLALTAVDEASNWKEARAQLQYVHEVAFYDLPLIPLWQTVNYFAHRDTLDGVGSSPVALYQNVANWKSSSLGAEE
ncbi:MAG: hypothetical protein KDA57_07770 [Planctomycetales bacterium]|nr:hypothetical protein [Planctomycetales bacterium]